MSFLLVQPPVGQAQFSGYCPGFFKHDAVRLEQGINITGGTARVIGQGHRGATEYVDVGHHAPLSQPVTKPAEGILDALDAEIAAAAQDAGMSYSAWIAQAVRKEFIIQQAWKRSASTRPSTARSAPARSPKPMSGPPGSPSRPPPGGPHDRGHLRFRGADRCRAQ